MKVQTWQQHAPWQLLPQPILKDLPEGEVTLWQQQQLQKCNMQAVKEVSLGVLTADSAEQLNLPKPPDKKHTAENALAYELRYHWEVSAPRLNSKAKEVKQTIDKEIEREQILVIKDKKGKPTKEKQMIKETIQKQVSYNPPVYSQNGHNVVAIKKLQEIPAAQNLIQTGIAKAIVVRD